MGVREVIAVMNQMCRDGVIEEYAIGGAVGATFYLEPAATLDIDLFVAMRTDPRTLIIDPRPIYNYLTSRGYIVDGEYILVAGWPVQFLVPPGPLVEEALKTAVEVDIEGVPAMVFSAEHLAAIALQTGRGKDKARLLQFIEEGAIDAVAFEDVVRRHGLSAAWGKFKNQFLGTE